MVLHPNEIKQRVQQLPHAERTINLSAAYIVVFELIHFNAVYGRWQMVFWFVCFFPSQAMKWTTFLTGLVEVLGINFRFQPCWFSFDSCCLWSKWQVLGQLSFNRCDGAASWDPGPIILWVTKGVNSPSQLRSSEQVDLGWSKAFPFHWHGRQLYHLEHTCASKLVWVDAAMLRRSRSGHKFGSTIRDSSHVWTLLWVSGIHRYPISSMGI